MKMILFILKYFIRLYSITQFWLKFLAVHILLAFHSHNVECGGHLQYTVWHGLTLNLLLIFSLHNNNYKKKNLYFAYSENVKHFLNTVVGTGISTSTIVKARAYFHLRRTWKTSFQLSLYDHTAERLKRSPWQPLGLSHEGWKLRSHWGVPSHFCLY